MSKEVFPPIEIIFPKLDYGEVLRLLNEQPTPKAQIDLVAADYSSLFSIALMTKFPGRDALLARIRTANTKILANAPGTPGSDHGLRFQVQGAFDAYEQALLMNSPVLTPDKVADIRQSTTVQGGAMCYIFLQFARTRKGLGDARSVHADTVCVPKNRDDGPAWVISSFISPYGRPGSVVDELFGSLQYPSLGLPANSFEQAQVNSPPDSKLGGPNIVHWSFLTDEHRTFPDVMSSLSNTPGKVLYHTTGVIVLDLDQDAYRDTVIVRNIISKSLELGAMPSLGAHCGLNSCAHCAVSINPSICSPDDRMLALDEALIKLAAKAKSLHWTHSRDLRMSDFFADQSRFTETDIDTFSELLEGAFTNKPVLTTVSADRSPYASQYLRFDRLPKDDTDAAIALLKKVLEIYAAYLEALA